MLSAVLIGALLLPGGAVFAANPLPLSAVAVPEPPNLATYVKDKAAAIKLGKALFWDMQAGSDGIQAAPPATTAQARTRSASGPETSLLQGHQPSGHVPLPERRPELFADAA